MVAYYNTITDIVKGENLVPRYSILDACSNQYQATRDQRPVPVSL